MTPCVAMVPRPMEGNTSVTSVTAKPSRQVRLRTGSTICKTSLTGYSLIFRPPSRELRNSDSAMANISARVLTLDKPAVSLACFWGSNPVQPQETEIATSVRRWTHRQRPRKMTLTEVNTAWIRVCPVHNKRNRTVCQRCSQLSGLRGQIRLVCPVMEATAIKVRVRVQATRHTKKVRN